MRTIILIAATAAMLGGGQAKAEEQCHVNGPIVCDPMNSDLPDKLRYDFTDPDALAWARAKCAAEAQANANAAEDEQEWSPICQVWLIQGRP